MQSVATHGGQPSFGWIGTGRMGCAMAARLLGAGCSLTVYNRTRSKTEDLARGGAHVVERISDLGECDVVFVTVASSDDLLSVLGASGGLLSADSVPDVVVDCSTVSAEASRDARRAASERGVALLAAPVSGNPKVARAGRLTMVVSGPRAAFDRVRPFLETVARSATYVGEGEESRLVKLCHNLMLGVVIESLAEITVLAERAGVRRHDFLQFLNDSVMGSMFTRYKSPALVNLDFKPSFTTTLLHKDFDLGLAAARALDVPMPVAGLVHQLLQDAIGNGIGDSDFAALLSLVARGAGMALEPENELVDDGLPLAALPEQPALDGDGGGDAARDAARDAAASRRTPGGGS